MFVDIELPYSDSVIVDRYKPIRISVEV